MKRLSSALVERVAQLLRERTGLALTRRDATSAARALSASLARTAARDEASYLARLVEDERAFDALVEDLTVPETYFFRDPALFDLLRTELLPRLVAARPPTQPLELWSAGCASGEEAYSLAILLEQEHLAGRAYVLGTDVSRRALDRAERAIYAPWSLRATRPELVARYFTPAGRGFRLTASSRERVRFLRHSLSAPYSPSPASRSHGFDLILCRNVLIYFDAEVIRQVGLRLAASLAADGWLVLGPSDPLLDLKGLCRPEATRYGVVYHRSDDRSAPAERSARTWPLAPPSSAALRVAAPVIPPPVERTPPRSTSAAAEPSPGMPPEVVAVLTLAREHGVRAGEVGCRDQLARHPLSAGLHLAHATLLFDLGRAEEAEEALRRALYLDHDLLPAHLLRATLAEQRGDSAGAARTYALLRARCRKLPPEQPVRLGEGLTHAALLAVSDQRLRALCAERDA